MTIMPIAPPPKFDLPPSEQKTLEQIIARAKRHPHRKIEPVGDMRERIGVSLRGTRPSLLYWYPSEAYILYVTQSDQQRQMYEEWSDRLLTHFDVHDLEVVDRRRME
jgi:hypothetical protein